MSWSPIIKHEKWVNGLKCFWCKGDIEQRLKTHAATLADCVIIIKNVPALVCKQCGEVFFTDEVMQKLEVIVSRLESIVKEVAIVDYTDNVT